MVAGVSHGVGRAGLAKVNVGMRHQFICICKYVIDAELFFALEVCGYSL